jgi:uncharacterized protein YbaR (Trm112 family)/SAM-dependent methyltransferase
MRAETLEILRCPFCGTRLTLVENAALDRDDHHVRAGVLGCECCAFPIVAGIPVLIASDTARNAMHLLEAGKSDEALHMLLDLSGERVVAFERFRRSGDAMTYREGVRVLSVDAEAEYFVYRFSDPTFRVGRAVVQATGWMMQRGGRYIDLCGGSGHLTRSMMSDRPAVLADVFFWKLWLAKTFVAPECEPVCCDANSPLPFARDTFSMVVLSDAFPYLWHKRLVADEMMRLAGNDGVIVMPHLHSSLGWNWTAGMPLTPAAYRDLLEPHQPRLFRDSRLLDQVLEGYLDLTTSEKPEAMEGEPSLVIVASRSNAPFRKVALPWAPPALDTLIVNPLYRVERHGHESVLTLTFPTEEYADEFAAAKRYLPETLTLPGDLTQRPDVRLIGNERFEELCRRLVFISAPEHYV